MIIFGLEDYKIGLGNWSKHHQFIGIKVVEDKSKWYRTITTDAKLIELASKYKDFLRPLECEDGVEYYLPLKNLNYKKGLKYFNHQELDAHDHIISVRYLFLIGKDKFFFDYQFNKEKDQISNLRDLFVHLGSVEKLIYEMVNKGFSIDDIGIAPAEDNKSNMFEIVLVSPAGSYYIKEIEKESLFNSLIKVEIYELKKRDEDQWWV